MDHCRKERRQTNPRETANIFSLLTFAYVGPLFKKANKKDLVDDDLYEVLTSCRSKTCGDKLETEWNKEKKLHKNPSVIKLISKCYGLKYLLLGFLDFSFNTFDSIARPYLISHLVAYFTPGQNSMTINDACFYGFGLIILSLSFATYYHNYIIWVQSFGMEIKTAFSSLLYRKSLKLSPTALVDTTLGNIVTLITRDVQSFVSVIFTINDTWIAVTQISVICYLLYKKIGVISFVGIGILLGVVPIQIFICSLITKFRYKSCKQTDERLQLTQEILSTMRIVKMYGWENYFADKINEARRKEIVKLNLGFYSKKLLILSGIIFSNLGFFMLIMACIWSGMSTDASVIFYILSNYRGLRTWMVFVVPYGMGVGSEFVSSYKRISKTLQSEELEPHETSYAEKPLIQITKANVKIKENRILKDINLKLTSGLTIITGPVGSGKSSLLKVILKDYPLESGTLISQGNVSYASQDPWLFPSSIKQNILFGEPYNAQRYQEVVRSCALLFDFNLLENGDETILTDRGSNLSKGQQARINLARAVYRNSDIYLLDDSLTALDASVQDYIFQECITKFLKNKICVLVSQTPSHINEADTVVIMTKGTIKDIGTPNEDIINEVNELIKEDDNLERVVSKEELNDTKEITEETSLLETEQTNMKPKIYKELKKEGSVDWAVYGKYLQYGGWILVILNIVLKCGTQFSASYSERLLTKWVDQKQKILNLDNNKTFFINSNQTAYYSDTLAKENLIAQNTFYLYALCLTVTSLLDLLTVYILLQFCKRASINIHKTLVKKISNAVMTFFDTHFIGNILNRFSQDMLNIDDNLSTVVDLCCRVMFNVGGILLLVIWVNPPFIIPIAIVFTILYLVRRYYLSAGRSLKRLEASCRSPMIGHLNATLEGLTTIRAFKVQETLINEYDRHQDLYTSANFTSWCCVRAFSFFIDTISTLLLLSVVVQVLFIRTSNTAGDIGLMITQISQLLGSLTFGIRQWTELENNMTSLERILEYIEIKTEDKKGAEIKDWPSRGSISYQNVSLSYEDNDSYVLKNLNFDIMPGEKIGIVGRTGAGKSSIISTIFRLYEVKGKILIDGVDIKTLSLDFLRKNIVVIPQDPILFSGTIRSNLDPLNVYQDSELWDTLDRVGLKKLIDSLQQEINSSILSFSSGQKQLFCLARAILRKNRIIVMDEASANMDQETDHILHQIIKDNFSDCTLITIAHRLHSVLECDKVMVLDRGEIKEFNDPLTLLEDNQGMFYKMVKQAGLLNYLS
ncbi:ATP-binding cassette sub-family C member 4-like [Diorhabda sublineata]|uniref:ATP-binding cassette sub-family C member 4-like n=1 Tax=Diorhabda sublineata TaxID=1163346 RepID=UPI0024E12384|nr:ATP-binding cassette sub-family C member 4-like [Diorhabda sublineata]